MKIRLGLLAIGILTESGASLAQTLYATRDIAYSHAVEQAFQFE